MLSAAKADATTELNVNSARSNGIVLSMPAKPPVSTGSGTPEYESDPTDVESMNREMLVALATEAVLRMVNPYPKRVAGMGSVTPRVEPLSPPMTGGVILLVGPKRIFAVSIKTTWFAGMPPTVTVNVTPLTTNPFTSVPPANPSKVRSGEPAGKAPGPTARTEP